MISRIIAWSAHHKFFVLALTLFSLGGAWAAVHRVPLDAIPDLSDTQVIVYSRWDRSPDILEDQVTYPIISALLGAPKIKAVRGLSDFGYSYVYAIFEDGTDLYWARSRVLEYLSKILPRLPEGVQTELGPDATSVGWVYQYALVDRSGRLNLGDLRSLQDWRLRYQLQSVPGVAEVAAVGGFQKQLQVVLDPLHLRHYNISSTQVADAVRKANVESGARLIEWSGAEFMVRGRGYVASEADLRRTVVGRDPRSGGPLLLQQVAHVAMGPDIRRGVSELDGEGEAPGGIIVMRQGENALNVIRRVKAKLEEIKPSLPEGVELVTVYDRSGLIQRSIETLTGVLKEEMLIVSLVILIFLWHIPSALVPILTIPISVFLAFIPLYGLGQTTNIMSLAGIAISIGVLVDGAIVEVENAYRKLELWIAGGRKGDFHQIRLQSLQEVGPSVFFSLLVIGVAFLPVFTLVDQEGRLFKPLAYSKNLAMLLAAILAVTLDPAVRMMFSRMEPFRFKPAWLARASSAVAVGTYYPEEKHPVSRLLFRIYEPACRFVLRHKFWTLIPAMGLFFLSIPVYLNLGSEFMPPLNEGAFLYMPTALPGMSVAEAGRILGIQDRVLKGFPEVERVFGKAGRAETPTDPAPFSMVETTVLLKPESQWRRVPRRWSWLPSRRIRFDEIQAEMDSALKLAGIPNTWTMPIKNRIDMLATGIRTPVGLKIMGPDLKVIQELGLSLEPVLGEVRGTRTVISERTAGGYYLDVDWNRDRLARYGISMAEAQMALMTAVGGENVSTLFHGRERYGINVRLAKDDRHDLASLKRMTVMGASENLIPLGELATLRRLEGPSMIRDENGELAGYVYIDVAGRDVGSYVEEAKKAVGKAVKIPEGYSVVWSGQYENMIRVRQRMKVVIPLTLFLIAMLLYMNMGSWAKAGIVLLAVPFSLVGAVGLLWILGYNVSIAVWVGMIALMGLDAETGVFMLLYLDLSHAEAVAAGKMRTPQDLEEAIVHGAVKRIRPKMMTVSAMFMGLLPLMWSHGSGSDMMKRVAAPMVGGIFTSFILELLIYPVLYSLWREKEVGKNENIIHA